MRIDLAGFSRDGTLGDHRQLMALVERCDALGFDGIWFNEFHFRGATNPYPSTLLLAAEIFGRTERLRFGTSILVLALQHPLLLAEQIAQLDFQSGGRIDVGIGRGTDPSTFATLGIPSEDIKPRFAEALDVLIRAWSGEPISSPGPHFPFLDVTVGPPVTQRPHPPIYVAGVSEDTVDMAAARGLPLLLSLEPNEARQMPVFEAALERHAAGVEPLRRSSLSRYVITDTTDAAAREKCQALLARLNARKSEAAAARGTPSPAPRSFAAMCDDFAIVGTPERCMEQLRALERRTGCESVRCLFSANGLIAMDEAEASLTLFAREALPELQRDLRPTRHTEFALEGTI